MESPPGETRSLTKTLCFIVQGDDPKVLEAKILKDLYDGNVRTLLVTKLKRFDSPVRILRTPLVTTRKRFVEGRYVSWRGKGTPTVQFCMVQTEG